MEQPKARVEQVYDSYFGNSIEDPYRWMEDWKGEETQVWLNDQANYTNEFFKSLSDREAISSRIRELDANGPVFSDFIAQAGRIFFLRRDPGDELAKLVVLLGVRRQEKILFNPNMIKSSTYKAINWYVPSNDGHYVAYSLSSGESEQSTLYVLDVESNKNVGFPLSRVPFARLTWLGDHLSFVYYRLSEHIPSIPQSEYYNNGCVYLHHINADPKNDRVVFGPGIHPGVEIARDDFPFLYCSPVSKWMIGMIVHSKQSGMTLYTAPQSALSDPTTCPWTKVADAGDAIAGFDFVEETIYLRTSKNAPHYKIITTSLKKPDMTNAKIIVPESAFIIKSCRVAGNFLLTRDLDGGIWRMRRVQLNTGVTELVSLPFDGTILEWTNDMAGPEVLLHMTSWTISPRLFLYHVGSETIEDTGICPSVSVDFSDIEVERMYIRSHDDIQIPLTILRQKNFQFDGKHPTLLKAYGSYGFTIDPFFSPTMHAWYERGGIYALAHVRGGGEYGEEWHKAGMKLNKQNTIDDLIICAQYLIEQRYTDTAYLACEGFSAGSIPCAGALVQVPELWAAVVLRAAVTNMLRLEQTESGTPNISEFGSVTTEEGFRSLQIIDAYSKVQPGRKYPAVLFTIGLFDTRVTPWQSTKMVARLQEATLSGKPILLRVDKQRGHDVGLTKKQKNEELADILAFLLHHLKL